MKSSQCAWGKRFSLLWQVPLFLAVTAGLAGPSFADRSATAALPPGQSLTPRPPRPISTPSPTKTFPLKIEGFVRLGDSQGAGLPGVAIMVSSTGKPEIQVAVTDQEGRFSAEVHDLPYGASLTIRPQLDGYVFIPPARIVNPLSMRPYEPLDFVAVPADGTPTPGVQTREIEGYVRLGSDDFGGPGPGLAGVRIQQEPPIEYTSIVPPEPVAVTDERGYYKGKILIVDGGVTRVWAELKGFVFEPREYLFTSVMPEVVRMYDFLAIPVEVTPTPPHEPGLIVRGSVWLASPGAPETRHGVGGVSIYMAFASYEGKVIAVTDKLGQYVSEFVPIPGEEQIRVWAELYGYRFEPEVVSWRHYAGFEDRRVDIVAIPEVITPTPSVGRIIEGFVRLGGSDSVGLAGVQIFRGPPFGLDDSVLPAPLGELIAVTDERGYYKGDVGPIGPNERVWVWPIMEGYRFEPNYYQFTAIMPLVVRTYDFVAIPADDITPTPIPNEPGVVVRGSVWLGLAQGKKPPPGLAGVRIILAKGYTLLPGQGELIAVTDQAGQYVSKFIPIEGEILLRVWAEFEGYSFLPVDYSWTHPAGFEDTWAEFVAMPAITPTPGPEMMIEGQVWLGNQDGSGAGVEGVRIYRSSLRELSEGGQEHGKLVAVTDASGYYQGSLGAVRPGDRIWIWAAHSDYQFKPRFHHIIGAWEPDSVVARTYDFLAFPKIRPWFTDVPEDSWAAPFIAEMYEAGFVDGCGGTSFCRKDDLTRAENAVVNVRAIEGVGHRPVDPDTPYFVDTLPGNWSTKWAQDMHRLGLTAGCSDDGPRFCPDMKLTNAQLAVFGLRLKYGSAYRPPTATGLFSDLAGHWAKGWVEAAYSEGLYIPCRLEPTLLACPDAPVDRQTAAYVWASALEGKIP